MVVFTTTAEVVLVFHIVDLIGVDFHSIVPRILAVTVVAPPHISLPVLLKESGADRARKLAFRSSL